MVCKLLIKEHLGLWTVGWTNQSDQQCEPRTQVSHDTAMVAYLSVLGPQSKVQERQKIKLERHVFKAATQKYHHGGIQVCIYA